ncbi:MAG: DUF4956 domain-containing protein [Bacilli bacterium]|nr:DUF4956 domain-containing protein [Bacilli bacterium]
MFKSILSDVTGTLAISDGLICIISSLVLGIIIAFVHMHSQRYTKNFIISLALLPVLVQVVIMMVNGNLGTSIAVMGAFSLIRFRSVPGTSRELISVFFAMAVGLAIGMGHVMYASTFTVILSAVLIIMSKTTFGESKKHYQKLKVLIPENLDYNHVFDDVFSKYTNQSRLDKIKTTNMGSMFELTYIVILKDGNDKHFIDDLRCLNGNLTITLSSNLENINEL